MFVVMAKITESAFWVNLLKKLLRQILRKQQRTYRKKTGHQHVVPHEEGWAVKGEGNERITATYKYQDDAIRRAKRIAKSKKADVIIHRADGTIRDRISYD
jgi:exo-beta-1,3-glucanase (GH17 family)